jgi:drug/metabolite transporter (DMT)-like permease
MRQPVLGPVLGLLFNALAFGVSWWPLREMQLRGLHPLWATAFMYGLALVAVSLLRPQAWRGLFRHPALWWLFAASGLTNLGFNWAVTMGDVVRVVLLFYTMPAWSVLFAWWLLGERPNRLAVLRLVVALAGVALVLKTPEMAWPWPSSLWDYLALLGGAIRALAMGEFAPPSRFDVATAMCKGACRAYAAVWFRLQAAWAAGRELMLHGWVYDLRDGLLKTLLEIDRNTPLDSVERPERVLV